MAHNQHDSFDQSKAQSNPAEPAKPIKSVQKSASAMPPKSLSNDIKRYMEAKDFATKRAIASEVACSQTHLWELCALQMGGVHTINLDANQALSHFASVYFNRGPEQKQELISLLQSDDLDLVQGLLILLKHTRDLDVNGKPVVDRALAGTELVSYISRVAKVHPGLATSVVGALSAYGELAKGEIATLLWALLSADEMASLYAKLHLNSVDNTLFARFGLDCNKRLTEGQREQILDYLRSRDKTPATLRLRRFPIRLFWAGEILNQWRTQKPDDSGASCNSLYGDIERYRAAKDDVERAVIANEVASSRTNLWYTCAFRVFFTSPDSVGQTALAHFVSAYYKRGPSHKEELFSLLQSRDTQLVVGLLWLLSPARDLDLNGKLQADKPLGGSEVPPYISQVARVHPRLASLAVNTLGDYGPLARSETATILRLVLSDDDSQDAIYALLSVDFDGLYSKFALDPDKPMTKEQRTEIEAYLKLHEGK